MKKIQIALCYVLLAHLLALVFMTLQRVVLLLTNLQHIGSVEAKFSWIFSALLRGVWFDNVIACYISILPLFILSVAGLFYKIDKWLLNGTNIYYLLLYIPVLGIGTANIPYFNYFFKHINASIFNWKEEGATTAGMIFGEVSYYLYVLLFVIMITVFGCSLFMLSKHLLKKEQKQTIIHQRMVYLPVCLLLLGFCMLGIRGRLGYNPIKTSQAYFCSNSFLNQLGINPSFYFARDVIELSKSYYNVDDILSEQEAISVAQHYLVPNSLKNGDYPLLRTITKEGEARDMNVVIILMESLSTELLMVKENGKEITPFLNSLIEKSYYFDHFYSAGTHTNHGVLATLYGLPALFDRNMMKNVEIPLCQGLPDALKEQGYKTLFFVTHEAQYDNMNAFLLENGIDEMYAEEDYPRNMRRNSFGVADDFLFHYALEKLKEKAGEPQPFMAVLLTVSNHPPYIVPDSFQSVSDDPQYQIVAFADDAIRQFMNEAEKEEWFRNTLFVLLGDHGKIVGNQPYEMPLSYNHIPLILYSPVLKDAPRRLSQLGGQVDVFPTVMGLLNRPYVNNTLGVDLLNDKERPYMFFSSDDALGCIDKDFFYTYNFKAKIENLYQYTEKKPELPVSHYKAKVDSMKMYSAAMFQVTDYMLKRKITQVRPNNLPPR